MNKCKGCKWYGKPYWSIINPCDNCPRENTNVEIITRWEDPAIEELKTQLQQKENIINELEKYINEQMERSDYTRLDTFNEIYDYLQELKGSDEECN